MNKINPRVDIAFKKIFGVEENKDLLISLINAVVSQEDQVSDVTILNPYNPQKFRQDKLSILDIKARGADGKRFNIEIQISDEADYDKRAIYYWGKLYTEQLKTSGSYSELNKAIGIHILNFISILDAPKYHNVFQIREKEAGFQYFKDLELHTIELKKFSDENMAINDVVAKIKNSLDMWVAFLTRHDLLNPTELPEEVDNASLQKAMSVLEIMNFSNEEMEAYEEHLKWLWIEANTVKKAEERGMERGMERGIERGMEIGLERGRMDERLQIAKSMHAAGLTPEQIQLITGLRVTEFVEP